MGIKQEMEKAYGIKKIKGEYVTKKEYNEHRKNRKDQILDEWIEKQETFEERQERIRKTNPFEINSFLEIIDKKFCIDTEKFVRDHGLPCTMSLDDQLKAKKIGRDIIINFILERSSFIIKSNAIFVPNCEGEGDIQRWFEENCNNLCLGIPRGSIRHEYDGIDIMCGFMGGVDYINYHFCEDNYYRPFLDKYMDNIQRQIYGKFYEFTNADHILIEIEEVSSNFIKHKHPSTVAMVICYEKDKEIGIPVLSINPGSIESENVRQ